MLPEQIPFFFLGYRSQLLKIANHEQLDAAEGFVAILITPQDIVYGIQQVTAHHGNLIDDQQVKGAENAELLFRKSVAFALGYLPAGKIESGCNLEEGMDCGAAGIDGSYTCRRQHNHAFVRVGGQMTQKSGFPCSCLACEKYVPVGILRVVIGKG